VDLWVEMDESHGAQASSQSTIKGLRWERGLEQLMATLPEPHGALVLRYQEDLTPEEIAATGCAAGHGKEPPAAGIEAAAGQGADAFEEFVRDEKFVGSKEQVNGF